MVLAKLDRVDPFKKLIESIKDLVQEAVFDIGHNGIEMQAMDNSHVSLVTFFIKQESFVQFDCPKEVSLGFNLISLYKILKCSQSDDSLLIKTTDDSDVVIIQFDSHNNDRSAQFELKLMSISSDHLGIPATEYDAVVQAPSSEFYRLCQNLVQIGDTVKIVVIKHEVQFSCYGDLGTGKIVLKQTSRPRSEENVEITVTNPIDISFSLKYFWIFSKAATLSSQVKLSLSPGVPALLEYQIAELDGRLRFYLAPKLDEV